MYYLKYLTSQRPVPVPVPVPVLVPVPVNAQGGCTALSKERTHPKSPIQDAETGRLMALPR